MGPAPPARGGSAARRAPRVRRAPAANARAPAGGRSAASTRLPFSRAERRRCALSAGKRVGEVDRMTAVEDRVVPDRAGPVQVVRAQDVRGRHSARAQDVPQRLERADVGRHVDRGRLLRRIAVQPHAPAPRRESAGATARQPLPRARRGRARVARQPREGRRDLEPLLARRAGQRANAVPRPRAEPGKRKRPAQAPRERRRQARRRGRDHDAADAKTISQGSSHAPSRAKPPRPSSAACRDSSRVSGSRPKSSRQKRARRRRTRIASGPARPTPRRRGRPPRRTGRASRRGGRTVPDARRRCARPRTRSGTRAARGARRHVADGDPAARPRRREASRRAPRPVPRRGADAARLAATSNDSGANGRRSKAATVRSA